LAYGIDFQLFPFFFQARLLKGEFRRTQWQLPPQELHEVDAAQAQIIICSYRFGLRLGFLEGGKYFSGRRVLSCGGAVLLLI